jgi:hypothetical protein
MVTILIGRSEPIVKNFQQRALQQFVTNQPVQHASHLQIGATMAPTLERTGVSKRPSLD